MVSQNPVEFSLDTVTSCHLMAHLFSGAVETPRQVCNRPYLEAMAMLPLIFNPQSAVGFITLHLELRRQSVAALTTRLPVLKPLLAAVAETLQQIHKPL